MSWTKRKEVQHEECPGLDEKLRKREDKIEQIKEILKKEAY
jgi:hypothetical protein